ncbi:MAG: ribosomal RNA small subunit methyltransferase A [Candidatus Moranbacteria bacterium CG_4_8_14_3_um_filter_34_16]|nr:MAG: ribosomal RNA small subunit methyltransferase A [Candidatus Moranbacteria bacterium CG08_land_8_20_14_0_20_34_16]PIW94780.1 MAG: ribosomal RNA small subunit methyltransferase A [Candidatus Moranbacteria bacterium CG_4_8_14_3_um_filter_34_16]PJA89181.1 MAG: ribosomal RNA small subunit methyltransferase A [Candidatus Moranbacteria bacterium CG_4_9_14_3_um_filter_33_15]
MKPKKYLGQNFLRDEKILKKIIEIASIKENDSILEVGPGTGALSFEIAKKTKNFIMVEKDKFLAEKIARDLQFPIIDMEKQKEKNWKFKNKKGVIEGDILKINLVELIEKNCFQNYKLVANIPYYITSPILRLFLETAYSPEEMILMTQKEVAERITAQPGQMSILSLSAQYYGRTELLFYVGRESFSPVPEVDSAVIRITPAKKNRKKEENKIFFRLVKAGFSSRRKTLLNNLSNSFHLDKKIVAEKIKKAKFNPAQRAQELSVRDWEEIVNQFSDLKSNKKL